MDEMAAAELALTTLRVRQSTLSSFCAWLVKRGALPSNTAWHDLSGERPPAPGITATSADHSMIARSVRSAT
jgi:hypothetical protein